ncbi:MAG: DUF2934 domain-containing protein [Rhodocyclaceae bacterium]|nr:DUF2934 domain-containing protein [Rhodocyclaceae bacterium]
MATPTKTTAKKAAAPAKTTAAKKTTKPAPAAKPAAAAAKKPLAAAAKKPAAKAAAKPAAKPKKAAVPSEQRRNYVEVAAYYIAERHGFTPGRELADWEAAEAEIDRLLAAGLLNP